MIKPAKQDNKACLEFIRHGMPEGGSRYRGHGVDDPLSELGWQQMWDALGDDQDWDAIVTSPMARCREFAQALGDKINLEIDVQQDLREIGFGVWEGKTRAELKQADPDGFERFFQDPMNHRPRGAEPVDALIQRVDQVVNDLLDAYRGQRVLVVCHAGIMRAVFSIVMQTPPRSFFRLGIPNALRMTLVPGSPLKINL